MNGLSIERIEVLLCVAALVALLARRARLPYTVGLVLAGAGLAALGVLEGITLTKDLVFRLLLPPLIFEASLSVRWSELRPNLGVVLFLATAGVLVSAGVIAVVMASFADWPLASAIVFGTLIAATDPVAVIAMFKELRIGGRLRLLMESESLLNDGVAAVAFSVALALAGGARLSAGDATFLLFREVGGGVACGAATAGAVLYLAGKTTEHLVELTFTTVTAFGAFLLAEYFHCSGVLAVLIAGLLIGNLGPIRSITAEGRNAVEAFWEFAAFVSNSIIFLLIGVRELALGQALLKQLPAVLLAIAACTIARAISVYGIAKTLGQSSHRISLVDQHVLFWGGLRGALSLALALGLPASFPAREQVLAATFGVVAFSVLVQGMTMPPLLRRLGLISASR